MADQLRVPEDYQERCRRYSCTKQLT